MGSLPPFVPALLPCAFSIAVLGCYYLLVVGTACWLDSTLWVTVQRQCAPILLPASASYRALANVVFTMLTRASAVWSMAWKHQGTQSRLCFLVDY